MKVKVLKRGGVDNRQEVERIVRFMASKLMSTRMANTLSIRVEMRASKLKGTMLGCVVHNASGDYSWKNRKDYRIVVRRDLDTPKLAEVIAHEMVHVKQYAQRELRKRYHSTEKAWRQFWMGQEVPRSTPYLDLPWEIEARKMESALKYKYLIEVQSKVMKHIANIDECVTVWKEHLNAELAKSAPVASV